MLFWIDKILSHIAENGFPKEIGMIRFAAGPVVEMIKAKAQKLDDAGALELISMIHALSAKLEDQTGVNSPFHYDLDSE